MTWAKLALQSLEGNGKRQACRPKCIPHSSSCLRAAALAWLAALSDESASKQELVIPTICRQVCFVARAKCVKLYLVLICSNVRQDNSCKLFSFCVVNQPQLHKEPSIVRLRNKDGKATLQRVLAWLLRPTGASRALA